MKKTILLLVLFASTAMTFTSCKKDEKPSLKEKNTEALTSGKWYMQTQTWPAGGTGNCFSEHTYVVFKADGTFEDSWSWYEENKSSGTYTVAEDGKSVTMVYPEGDYSYTFEIVTATDTSLVYKIWVEDDEGFSTVTLAKTVAPPGICV